MAPLSPTEIAWGLVRGRLSEGDVFNKSGERTGTTPNVSARRVLGVMEAKTTNAPHDGKGTRNEQSPENAGRHHHDDRQRASDDLPGSVSPALGRCHPDS